MFYRFAEAVRRFMYGRYGFDRLTVGLLVIYLIISAARSVIWFFTKSLTLYIILGVLMTAAVAFALFRVLSRNTERRRRELMRYNALRIPVMNRLKVCFKSLGDRSHKYMICPECRAVIRFPRKKGTHPANCPKCRALITVKIR